MSNEANKEAVLGTCMSSRHPSAPPHPMNTSCFNWRPLPVEAGEPDVEEIPTDDLGEVGECSEPTEKAAGDDLDQFDGWLRRQDGKHFGSDIGALRMAWDAGREAQSKPLPPVVEPAQEVKGDHRARSKEVSDMSAAAGTKSDPTIKRTEPAQQESVSIEESDITEQDRKTLVPSRFGHVAADRHHLGPELASTVRRLAASLRENERRKGEVEYLKSSDNWRVFVQGLPEIIAAENRADLLQRKIDKAVKLLRNQDDFCAVAVGKAIAKLTETQELEEVSK